MKIKRIAILICMAFIVSVMISGCATVVTRNIDPDPKKDKHRGIRVYPTAVYLIVANGKMTFIYLPDYTQGYDIKPRAIFARNNFNIGFENGQVKALSADVDTTAFLTFMEKVFATAAKAIPAAPGKGPGEGKEVVLVPLSSIDVKGWPELKNGIYRINKDGTFTKIDIIEKEKEQKNR